MTAVKPSSSGKKQIDSSRANNKTVNDYVADLEALLKEAGRQIAAGGAAGFVEVCLMHPLDLVKTRMQLQTTVPSCPAIAEAHLTRYSGVFDCFQKMRQQEGIRSYWKGILPPILAETPKRAVKFFSFEQYKKLATGNKPFTSAFDYSLAGAAAGVTEAIIVNPFEVVKITLQSDRSSTKRKLPTTWAVTQKIIKTQGIGSKGLNKGLSATIARNGVFNMVYFGFYNSVKDLLPEFEGDCAECFRKFMIGFTAGVLASCLNIPFDVAKSRMQGPQPTVSTRKYTSLLRTMNLIRCEEGYLAFYKGLVPKIMRLGPGGAIMMLTYDFVYGLLREDFASKTKSCNKR